jgi:hypothetical protein
MKGMIGDLYRKFDRLKIMSESYSDEDIQNKEKEITDQFYDIISYCQLQLYWLRRERWGKVKNPHAHTFSWNNTDSGSLKAYTSKDGISAVYVPESIIPTRDLERYKKEIEDFISITGYSIKIDPSGVKLRNIDENKLCELIIKEFQKNLGR